MLIALFIALTVCTILLLLVIAIYNRLVQGRNMMREAWSGIDVQLRKRADLVPALVDAVKGYMAHEKTVLEEVTSIRERTLQARDIDEQAAAAGNMSASLGRLLALAEDYPELKAEKQFLDLQERLTVIEEDIEMARRYYNGTVRELNTAIEVFPNSLIAGVFHFRQAPFFQIENPSDREVPATRLSPLG